MFGHLEFYFGKYVRLECNPIPALISGIFQFHKRGVFNLYHRVFIGFETEKVMSMNSWKMGNVSTVLIIVHVTVMPL